MRKINADGYDYDLLDEDDFTVETTMREREDEYQMLEAMGFGDDEIDDLIGFDDMDDLSDLPDLPDGEDLFTF